MTERSILENTSADVKITHLYPDVEIGCTGFSRVRFGIKHGIYMDCDMVVLGDIQELWGYRVKDKNVVLWDGSTEVMVLDAPHNVKQNNQRDQMGAIKRIPKEWNIEDYNYFPDKPLPKNMKLFHFTTIPKQPWFYDHPNKEAVALYERYKA